MRAILPVIVLGLFVVGCADSSDRSPAPDSEIYIKFTQARDSVMVGDSWSESIRRLEERLGPATMKTDTEWRWATVQGDECFDLKMMRAAEFDRIERITNTYAAATAGDEFKRCKAMVPSSRA